MTSARVESRSAGAAGRGDRRIAEPLTRELPLDTASPNSGIHESGAEARGMAVPRLDIHAMDGNSVMAMIVTTLTDSRRVGGSAWTRARQQY
jgi:hypothetical protein